jgi:hypothetical protein
VSIRRMAAFLAFPEMSQLDSFNHSSCNAHNDHESTPSLVISLENVTCYWNYKNPSSDTSTHSNSLSPIDASETIENEASLRSCSIALSSINLNVNKGELCCVIVRFIVVNYVI